MKIKRIAIFIVIICFLILTAVYYPKLTGNCIDGENFKYNFEETIVLRVIDGDTIETEFGTIRLLGINTPEKNMQGYEEGKDFLKELENKTIDVLRDKEDTDKYNRLLRYVFYNNKNINIEIIEKGLANIYMFEDLVFERQLIRAQEYARDYGLGIWQKSKEKCSECIILEELNPQDEYFILQNDCNFDCNLVGWYVKDAGRHLFYLKEIKANQEIKIESKTSVWNNDHDEFFLIDPNGKLVVYYEY